MNTNDFHEYLVELILHGGQRDMMDHGEFQIFPSSRNEAKEIFAILPDSKTNG